MKHRCIDKCPHFSTEYYCCKYCGMSAVCKHVCGADPIECGDSIEVYDRKFELTSNAPEFVKLPTRKTKGSAGYDFYLPFTITVPAHGYSEIVPTYVKAYMPKDEVLLLHIRSSIGLLKGITLANNTGIIDSDYVDNPENEGNIGLRLYNHTDKPVVLRAGERVMQGIFIKYQTVDNDITTEERKGGTGSTGR